MSRPSPACRKEPAEECSKLLVGPQGERRFFRQILSLVVGFTSTFSLLDSERVKLSKFYVYLIIAFGVVAFAAFYIGKSQSQIVFVQTERIVYKPYTQAEEKELQQRLLRQEQKQYLQDARVINQALLVWAKDHAWGKNHIDNYKYGVLPEQGELFGGCLNNYDTKHLAQSYAEQGILSVGSTQRVAIAYPPGVGPDAPSSNPSKFVVAQMQTRDKKVTVYLYGDGHVRLIANQ